MAQGAQFLYGASTEITNDHGEQIDKQYLISKIKSVGASVKEIQEGFQSLDDGLVAPDDPGAAKLIADQNKLSDVIDDVSGKFPESVAKVKAAFDYYVRTVIDRNTQILTYNSIVIEMVKTSADLVHAQQRIQDLNDASLTASEANWPDVTAYVSCLYYKAREFILKEFDNAARAYQFWAINDEDILGPALGERTPPKIDYNALNNGFVSLREKYVDAVEDFGTDPDSFDSILLSLTAEQVSTLTLCRSVMVSIPPVRSWTTSDDNPFYGLTHVRITGVRVWLTFADGATYQGDVQIELTHSGPEQNRFAQRRALQLHARTHSQDVSLQHRHQEGDHRAVVWFVQAGGEIRIGWPLHKVAYPSACLREHQPRYFDRHRRNHAVQWWAPQLFQDAFCRPIDQPVDSSMSTAGKRRGRADSPAASSAAASPAAVIMAWLPSTATTEPPGGTSLASAAASSPSPQPTSRIRRPGAAPTTS